jgi:hypothetical protein
MVPLWKVDDVGAPHLRQKRLPVLGLSIVVALMSTAACGSGGTGATSGSSAVATTTQTTVSSTTAAPTTVPTTTTTTEKTTTVPLRSGNLVTREYKFSNERRYEYAVSATVDSSRYSKQLADPGFVRLTTARSWTIRVKNLLTDRPAPVGSGNGPGLGFWYEISPSMASTILGLREAKQRSGLGFGVVYVMDGVPVVPVYLGLGATVTRLPSQIPSGSSVEVRLASREPLSVLIGGVDAIPEDLADGLLAVLNGPPRWLSIGFPRDQFGASNCNNDGGPFSGELRLYFSTAPGGEFGEPNRFSTQKRCDPDKWKG